MRWELKIDPLNGEERIVEKFLWIPTRIGRDVRWLEFTIIKQKYNRIEWNNVKWLKD